MMDIVRISVLAVLILNLSGCVETKPPARPYPQDPYYKKVIRSWIGKPLNKLVREWETPDKTYSTNSIKFVIYNKPLRYIPLDVIGPWHIAYCTYTFELSKKDIILRGKAEGWACPLYEDEIDNGIEFGKTRPKPK